MGGDIYVISGNQGAGKSTVGKLLAERFRLAAHIDGDEMQRLIISGRRWPESVADIDGASGQVSGEAGRQLQLRLRNGCLLASSFADAGITAILTDIICGSRFDEMLEHLGGRAFYFVMLRPPVEVLRHREVDRGTGVNDFEPYLEAAIDATPHTGLWLDSARMSPNEIVEAILGRRKEAAVTPKS